MDRVQYILDLNQGTVHRADRLDGIWNMSVSGQRVLLQVPNSDMPIERSDYAIEACNAIASDLARTHPSDLSRFPVQFEQFKRGLGDLILRRLRRSRVNVLSWYRILSQLERSIPELPTKVTLVLTGIRQLEIALADASAGLNASPIDPTQTWDIEGMAIVLLSRRRIPPQRVIRFARDLMDLKFKVFSLVAADVPTYAERIRTLPGNGPAANLLALSFDGVLAFKCRAIWETIMNMTYHLETGLDAERQWGKNKSRHWWSWVRSDRHWRGLYKFRRALQRFDDLLRTPEAHKSSTLRATFARDRSPHRHRQLANHLVNVSIGVWAHTGMVLTLDQGLTYARGHQHLTTRPKR